MRKLPFNLLLFLLFILEGTIFSYLSLDQYGFSVVLVPRFTLILIIFISMFYHRHYGLLAGIILGLLYDIIYGKGIGVHMGGLAVIGYISGWLMHFFQPSFLMFIIIEGIGIFTYEIYLYGIHRLFQLFSSPFQWTFLNYLFPTLAFNVMVSILSYKLLNQWIIKEDEEDKA